MSAGMHSSAPKTMFFHTLHLIEMLIFVFSMALRWHKIALIKTWINMKLFERDAAGPAALSLRWAIKLNTVLAKTRLQPWRKTGSSQVQCQISFNPFLKLHIFNCWNRERTLELCFNPRRALLGSILRRRVATLILWVYLWFMSLSLRLMSTPSTSRLAFYCHAPCDIVMSCVENLCVRNFLSRLNLNGS